MNIYFAATTAKTKDETHAVTSTEATELHATTVAAESTEAGHEEKSILGLDPAAFIIQLITFVLVFMLLKKFALNRIVKMLDERRTTIDDGIRLGQKMEAERDKLQEEVQKIIREARFDADRIIGDAQKEAREIIREAEKVGQRKVDAMMVDAEARIAEEADQARRTLEKEITGLISEATEAVVGEKVDDKKDKEIIEKVLKGKKR